MEREQYNLMYQQEGNHWWYLGMRRISAALLDRYPPRSGGDRSNGRAPIVDILDAGCGSGGTTRFLERWGRVTGIDVMPKAVGLARQRGVERLARGSVSSLPFADASFDIVTSFDVLYHLAVESDRLAVGELHRVTRPNGVVLIRLPAYDWIRGAHDVAVHTRHRYTRSELCEKLRSVGFQVEHATYANFFLFPLAPLKRWLERGDENAGVADLWRPPAFANRLLSDLLSAEAVVASRIGLPWGLSVFAVARRVQPLAVGGADAPRRTQLSGRTS